MEPDINAIEEQHFERFLDRCQQNFALRCRVMEVFATDNEMWQDKEYGRTPEEMFDRCFDAMYRWDAEFFTNDPMHAIGDYEVERGRTKCLIQ